MKIEKITCSGVNETTNIDYLFWLHKEFPKIEFAIQVSRKKCSYGSPRWNWLCELIATMHKQHVYIPLALHFNQEWAEMLGRGESNNEVYRLLASQTQNGAPIFSRIQINFKIGRERVPNIDILPSFIEQISPIKVILPYNIANHNFLNELCKRTQNFDCIFDESGGEGIPAESYMKPLIKGNLQTYAGGLSHLNIIEELTKINQLVDDDTAIAVDAETGLKDENGNFSITLARKYAKKVIEWEKGN